MLGSGVSTEVVTEGRWMVIITCQGNTSLAYEDEKRLSLANIMTYAMLYGWYELATPRDLNPGLLPIPYCSESLMIREQGIST